MRILFLVVARGGSKRIHRKNLQRINGISLLGYKASAAKKSRYCSQITLSTEDQEIAKEGNCYGISLTKRPSHLASDTATTEDVVRHAQEAWEGFDAIMLLEPSSPFVPPWRYDQAVELMIKTSANFVFGHVLYLFSWEYLQFRADLYDNLNAAHYFDMPTSEAVDIDTPHDLEHARWLAANGYVDLSWAK